MVFLRICSIKTGRKTLISVRFFAVKYEKTLKAVYIHRTISSKDKRSYCLTLDSKGQMFLNSYISYQTDIGNRIISGLDENEKQQLVMLLGKIASYMVRR